MARRPYPWPASRLDPSLMRRLLEHRQRTGERMTAAIRRAVLDLLASSEAEAAALRVAEQITPFDATSADTPDMSNMSDTSSTPVEIGHPRGQD